MTVDARINVNRRAVFDVCLGKTDDAIFWRSLKFVLPWFKAMETQSV
jgi:hypothetical protein